MDQLDTYKDHLITLNQEDEKELDRPGTKLFPSKESDGLRTHDIS